MADDEVIKVCLNPDCTGKNPMKGNWCTAKECKDMRKFAMAAKKADKQAKACAAVVLRPIMWDVTRVWARRRLRASVTLDIMGYYGIFWDILGYSGIYGAVCFFGRIRLRRKEGVTRIY